MNRFKNTLIYLGIWVSFIAPKAQFSELLNIRENVSQGQKNVEELKKLMEEPNYTEVFQPSEERMLHQTVIHRFQNDFNMLASILNRPTDKEKYLGIKSFNFKATSGFLIDQVGDIVPSSYWGGPHKDVPILRQLMETYWRINDIYTNLQKLQGLIIDGEEKRIKAQKEDQEKELEGMRSLIEVLRTEKSVLQERLEIKERERSLECEMRDLEDKQKELEREMMPDSSTIRSRMRDAEEGNMDEPPRRRRRYDLQPNQTFIPSFFRPPASTSK